MKVFPNRIFLFSSFFVFLIAATVVLAVEEPIDRSRARELHQESRRGETLSAEEQAYLDRARKARAAGEWRVSARQSQPVAPSAEKAVPHFTPLTELDQGKYQGEDGGLYGGGINQPPKQLQAAIKSETGKIQRLDREGKPSASGKIVLLSVGMSNTTREFSHFKLQADGDPQKSASLLVVDGAQGGQDAVKISSESAPFWSMIDARLQAAGVTPQQVQVVWLKQAIARPTAGFPAETKRLQGLLVKIVSIAKKQYPNLRVCYLSSRTYAGYAESNLNPEPYAYESAFAVRSLILDQLGGNPALNFDASRGAVKAPLLVWGPYLWADGTHPRRTDGLNWKREDFGPDGTHPDVSGRQKVTEQLLQFFKTDPNARTWFLKSP